MNFNSVVATLVCLLSTAAMAQVDLHGAKAVNGGVTSADAAQLAIAGTPPKASISQLFTKGSEQSSFSLKGTTGGPPQITIMDKTWAQQYTALALQKAAVLTEKDEARKKLLKPESKITLKFEGVVFRLDAKDKNKVWITLVGDTGEYDLTKPISKESLEAGALITLSLPHQEQELAGFGVSGDGTFKLQYDANTDTLKNFQATGSIEVNTGLKTLKDSGQTIGSGIRFDKLQRRPKIVP